MRGLALALFFLPGSAWADVDRLESYLAGTFETGTAGTPAHVKAVIEPLWPERADGPWMLFSMKPQVIPGWMQAFYRLKENEAGDTVIESWRIWNGPYAPGTERQTVTDFDDFDLSTATYLDGCDVVLTLDAEQVFQGGHAPKGACSNSRQGASYVWAEKWFAPDSFMFWENGYDAQDQIVWGPTDQGYTFTRIED